jgi:hypothetical protein
VTGTQRSRSGHAVLWSRWRTRASTVTIAYSTPTSPSIEERSADAGAWRFAATGFAASCAKKLPRSERWRALDSRSGRTRSIAALTAATAESFRADAPGRREPSGAGSVSGASR